MKCISSIDDNILFHMLPRRTISYIYYSTVHFKHTQYGMNQIVFFKAYNITTMHHHAYRFVQRCFPNRKMHWLEKDRELRDEHWMDDGELQEDMWAMRTTVQQARWWDMCSLTIDCQLKFIIFEDISLKKLFLIGLLATLFFSRIAVGTHSYLTDI